MENKCYEILLSFRNANIQLLNNRYQAGQGLTYLQKSFERNKELDKDHIRFMEEIISKGYVRKSTSKAVHGKIWYLPCHGVYHPNKPEKISRVYSRNIGQYLILTRKDTFYLKKEPQNFYPLPIQSLFSVFCIKIKLGPMHYRSKICRDQGSILPQWRLQGQMY